ncbi:MAG: amidohydrolase family protein [Wenzhouxiangella sp.]
MRIAIAVLMLTGISLVLADDLRQPTPGVHALVDVRIIPEPGQVIESGTIVMRDGVIEAVGADVRPPPDARIHRFEREEDQEPVTIYAGLIEPYLLVDTTDDNDNADESTPSGRHELINPDFYLNARHWPTDEIQALRRAGFTTALMASNQGLLRGHGTVANTGDGGLAGNMLVGRFGQFASFEGRAANQGFPSSLMGAVALMRQTLDDARWQAQAREAWQNNPAQPRPEWLEGLDDLAPAMAGQASLIFESQDMLDTLRIMEFIEPGSVDLVVVGNGREYQRLDALSDRPLRHILPLDFPEAPDIKNEEDRNVSLEELRHWRDAPDNAKRLADARIPMMFTTRGLSQPEQVFAQLAIAIERGLNPDYALAAVTTEPARWLGLSDRSGRIRTGFMANLLVVEGELFTENPAISDVWIDGRLHVMAAIEPPAVDPAGTWALTLGMGAMGDVDASLVLSGPPTNMEGTLTVMGNETPLNEVRVSGERVIASIDAARFGGSGTISIRMDIDGDRARGTGSGPFGEFTVRGRRTGGPDEEESN